MADYYTTIGLEIHAELKTNTKVFCDCRNDPDEESPNVYVCPVCTAQPGTLPVLNKAALDHMVRVGLSIDGKIADFTEFDRKNYFYPDIPKAYQISQFKYPIVSGGHLAGIDITRIHLEEDTATSTHDKGDYSLVNFNRAGVPLMELVTEPCIHKTEEIGKFGKELQNVLRYLGASDANMEKGEMRVEVNISISPDKEKMSKNYVELKNINSFRAAERAAEYEIKRMTELWDEGRQDEIIKETRGWDEVKQMTFSQRTKENAEDYRYFPEPDLPKFYLHSMYDLEAVKNSLPELPEVKRKRFASDYGIKTDDIEVYIFDPILADYFEGVVDMLGKNNKDGIQTASNFIISDILGAQKTDSSLARPNQEMFAQLMQMFIDGNLSSRSTKDILLLIMKGEVTDPKNYAEENGLIQKNDEGALKLMAQKAIDENPTVVATYKSGKENAIMSLVGQIMKESRGSANPAMVQKILKELLS